MMTELMLDTCKYADQCTEPIAEQTITATASHHLFRLMHSVRTALFLDYLNPTFQLVISSGEQPVRAVLVEVAEAPP